jgi:hypothetical protein
MTASGRRSSTERREPETQELGAATPLTHVRHDEVSWNYLLVGCDAETQAHLLM